jgi:iron-regulated transporter 1
MRRDIYSFLPILQDDSVRQANVAPTNATSLSCTQYIVMWKHYVHHPTFLASFSFCALYMTVLCGNSLNIAYLQWRGVSLSLLGGSSGMGALFGLIGTLLFPILVRQMQSVERVAVLSVWLFWLTLLPVGAVFFFKGESRASDFIMIGAVLVSRMWLWCTDLAETQIMQEWVEERQRGLINAMQMATSKVFYILILLTGLIFSDPRQFEALVFMSIAAVGSAAIGFTAWFFKFV